MHGAFVKGPLFFFYAILSQLLSDFCSMSVKPSYPQSLGGVPTPPMLYCFHDFKNFFYISLSFRYARLQQDHSIKLTSFHLYWYAFLFYKTYYYYFQNQ